MYSNIIRFCVVVVFFCLSTVTHAQTITSIAGNRTNGFSGDGGQATAAALNSPAGLAITSTGIIYIADLANNRVRKITASGVISTFAGNGTAGASGDGGAATAATLNSPMAVAVDAAGNVFIADYNNAKIRKVSTAGIITTVAGTGTVGFSANGTVATAAQIAKPTGVAVDASGNIYLAEQNNQVVRKVNTSGILSTVVGGIGAGFSGDGGQATAAAVSYPYGVAVDASGNLLITDNGNNRIRKVSTSGIITTLAGNGSAGFSGDGGNATAAALNNPSGVIFDPSGNLYIADQNNNRVRMVNSSGIISTYAGTATGGYGGDGGAATACTFYKPASVAFLSGNLYIADMGNSAVRKIGTAAVSHNPSFTGGAVQTLGLCTSASATAINTLMAITDVDASQTETWTVTQAPLHGTLGGFPRTATSTGGVVTPASLTYTPTAGYTGTDSFKVQVSDGALTGTTTIRVTTTAAPSAGTITGATSVCAGSNITLANTVTGGTWSSANTTVASVSTAGVVMGVAAGNTTISYTVTNSCGTAVATKADTVKAFPSAGTISGATSQCVGTNMTLTTTGTGGTWSTSNTAIATVTTAGVVRGVAAGVAVVSYTVSNSCGSSFAFKADTVSTSTTAGAISGAATVCVGAATTYTNTTSGGTWTSGSAGIATVNSAGVVTGITAGAATISYTVTNGCGTATVIKVITVNPLANAGVISGATSVSVGATTTLGETMSGGSGVWSSSNPSIASINSIGILWGIGVGSATISFTVTNSCGSVSATSPMTVTSGTTSGSNTIYRFAGTTSASYSGDGGTATAAAINHPSGLAVDASGNIYIADAANNRVRRVSTSGVITTIAGNGTTGYGADGVAATATNFDGVFAVAVDAASNVYIADYNNNRVRVVNASGTIRVLMGGGYESIEGYPATTFPIARPNGIAVDGSGNVYVSDQNNNKIWKVSTTGFTYTAAGNFTGGFSGDGGPASAANISYPGALTVDAAGNLYFVDANNNRVRKVSTSGIITTVAGNGSVGSSGDGGPATAASLNIPSGLAIDASGNLFITDQGNQRIRQVSPSGIITTIAGTGAIGSSGDGGPATAATFYNPMGIVAFGGRIYVADMGNNTVRQIGTATVNRAPTFNGGVTQSLSACAGTATSLSARLAITDIDAGQTETWTVVSAPAHGSLSGLSTAATSNGAIVMPGTVNYTPTSGYSGTDTFRIRVSDGTYNSTTLITANVVAGVNAGVISGPSKVCANARAWVNFTNTVPGGTWSTSDPSATTINSITGALYPNWGANFVISYTVANVCGMAISTKADTSLIPPVLGAISGASAVGVGATITLTNSYSGGVWSSSNNAIASVTSAGVVRGNSNGYATITYTATNYCGTSSATKELTVGTPSVSPNIYNFAGNNAMSTGYESSTYKDDGFNANSRKLYFPSGVAKDRNGFIYFSEQGNSLVRKVSTITGELITIAGNYPNAGYSGDGGQATSAMLNIPAGVAVDKNGNVYIADQGNARIRKVSTSGVITTVAGTGTIGYTADGATAASAQIAMPMAVAVDTLGNVYFAEQNNHRIRKISSSGILTTVVGNGSATFSGDGGAATAAGISYPAGVWLDAARNIYVADAGNNRIRKVNTSGIITTVAGNGSAGYSGENSAATAAALNNPYGVTTDSAGNLYIADRNNNKIRKVSTSGIITTVVGLTNTGGNYGPATASPAYYPQGVVVDGDNLYIADFGNHEVRIVGSKVPYMYSGPFTLNSVLSISPCKNSGALRLDSMLTVRDLDLGQVDTFKIRIAPLHGTVTGLIKTVATNGGLITPSNVFYTPASGYAGPDTFWIKICDRFDSANIWFFVNTVAAPSLSAISGASTVAISTPITLTHATAGGVWTSTNPARATVSTAGVVRGLTTGADTIVYTVDNGCGTSFVMKGITVVAGRDGQGAEDPMSAGIAVFPNPANGELSIILPADNTAKVQIKVVDMTGRAVYDNESMPGTDKVTVNTQQWQSGNYIIKVNAGDSNLTRLLTVVH